jgi:hypothetical protein
MTDRDQSNPDPAGQQFRTDPYATIPTLTNPIAINPSPSHQSIESITNTNSNINEPMMIDNNDQQQQTINK